LVATRTMSVMRGRSDGSPTGAHQDRCHQDRASAGCAGDASHPQPADRVSDCELGGFRGAEVTPRLVRKRSRVRPYVEIGPVLGPFILGKNAAQSSPLSSPPGTAPGTCPRSTRTNSRSNTHRVSPIGIKEPGMIGVMEPVLGGRNGHPGGAKNGW